MFQAPNIKVSAVILFFMTTFLSITLFALPDDDKKPLHIVSDTSSFNYKTGDSLYTGNVKATQGTAVLTADRLETHNNAQHKIREVIATGTQTQPAKYETLLKLGAPPLHAKASIIFFYPLTSLVILKGNAKVTYGKNVFTGPLLTYNMKEQVAIAPPSPKGRATVVIKPDEIAQ